MVLRRVLAVLPIARALLAGMLAVAVLAAAGTASAANSRSAAIVVDGANGKILYAENPDSRRYPASLTKMMTLYVLFEEMSRGRISNETRFEVSAYAAGQAPSKLGLRPGQTITVLEAIRSLVTRSANDAAVVIAENVSGSEAAFAQRMTLTARRLGMASTVFRNANGLPNPGQYSTARDLATLGLALQRNYPEQFKHFSTRSFNFRGQTIGNHNRLLGRIEGVDGIKTGFIRASGFNLVTSVNRDNRHLVAVVLGGSTGRERDNRMAKLVTTYLPRTQRSTTIVAAVSGAKVADTVEVAEATDILTQALKGTKPASVAALDVPVPVAAPRAEIAALQSAQAKVELAKAEITKAEVAKADADVVAAAPVKVQPAAAPGAGVAMKPVVKTVSASDRAAIEAILARELTNPSRTQEELLAEVSSPVTALVDPDAGPGAAPRTLAEAAAALEAETSGEAQGDAEIGDDVGSTASIAHSGWKIQIGAMPSRDAAVAYLDEARDRFDVLASREPYTEAVVKGSTTLYRARFAGFASQSQAQSACAQLAKRNYSCLALRQ